MKLFSTTLTAIEKVSRDEKLFIALYLCINSQNPGPSLLSTLSFICFPIEWKVGD